MKFNILGTKFNISYIYFAVITVAVLCDKTGLIIPTLFAVLIHESSHIIAMRILGDSLKEINLIPGSVQIVNNRFSKFSNELLTLFAGPLSNIIAYAVLKINCIAFDDDKYYVFAIINLFLGCFNLLPLYGLDGGGILRILLCKHLPYETADRIICVITVLFSVIMLLFGVYLFYKKTANLSVIIISVYFIIATLFKI